MLQYGCQIEEPIMDSEGQQVGVKVKNHPAVAVANACWRNVRSFCSEFGLSPVSRTRLTLAKPDTSEADLMEILSAPRVKREDVQ